jgi:hypothetical protein
LSDKTKKGRKFRDRVFLRRRTFEYITLTGTSTKVFNLIDGMRPYKLKLFRIDDPVSS